MDHEHHISSAMKQKYGKNQYEIGGVLIRFRIRPQSFFKCDQINNGLKMGKNCAQIFINNNYFIVAFDEQKTETGFNQMI